MRTEPGTVLAASPIDLARTVGAGWRTVLVAVAITVGLAAVYVYYIADEKYTATGRVMIEKPGNLYPSTPGVAEDSRLDQSTITSQAEALASRDLLRTVLQRLETEGELVVTPASREETVDQLQESLKVSVLDESHIITAKFTDESPQFAQKTLALLFDEYIRREVERRNTVSALAREQYEERSAALRSELESLNRQIALQSAASGRYFGGEGGTIQSNSMQAALGQVNDLEAQITDVSARLKVAKEAVSSGSWAEAARTLQTPTMQKLLQNQIDLELEAQIGRSAGWTDRHPESLAMQSRKAALDEMMKTEVQHAIVTLGETRSQLLEQARDSQSRMSTLRSNSNQELRGSATLDQLERSADSLREMLNDVVGRLYDTTSAPSAHAWIMEAPTASLRPTSPRPRLTFAGATLLGLLGGSLIAILRQGRALASRSALEFDSTAAIPSMWSLPAPRQTLLASRKNGTFDLAQTQDWQETLRAIGRRLALNAGSGGRSLAVVSAQPKEGKTMVSLALSRRLAADGYKVLLIDGDLRKPDIYRRADTGVPGSMDTLLAPQGNWRDAVQVDPASKLHLIAPRAPSDPAAGILRDGTMLKMIEAAKKSYDFVIVDSSPVLRVVDGLFLLDCVDSAVFVSNERTDPAETRHVLEQPDFPLAKFEGVIRLARSQGSLSYPGY
jgi:succinoglycan biosynthesis transport protein ExoP